jgi:uncharacterized membrane protein YfcA
LSAAELSLLCAGGFVAGIINTLAGGGSLITVPLLVVLGLPGTVANATNRVGVLLQSIVGAWRFRAEGVSGFRDAGALIAPLLAGAAVGAVVVSGLDDRTFERLFAVVMLVMLVPMLRGSVAPSADRSMPPALRALMFFGIGLYGGAIQAGVGIFLIFALSTVGHDLVRSNSIKMVLVAAFTSIAVAVFVFRGQVVWYPALVLATANSVGAAVGARIAVRGGERVIRPVLVVSVAALAGRMLGVY